jgi:glycerate-2-kinase
VPSRARIDDPRVARIVDAALAACDPREATRRTLDARALRGPVSILAFGKCAAPMMRGALEAVSPDEAMIVTVAGEHADLVAQGVTVRIGSHPEPAPDAPRHGEEALALAVRAEGTLLVLASGGGSALLEVPAPGLSMRTISEVARTLMHHGAPIEELNLVRAALSSIKGGRLAAATRAQVLTLAVEDAYGASYTPLTTSAVAPVLGSIRMMRS